MKKFAFQNQELAIIHFFLGNFFIEIGFVFCYACGLCVFFFFFCLLCSGTWVKSFLWELSFKLTFKERISMKVVLALRMLTETRGEYITGIQRKILEKFLKIYISLSWEVKKIKNLELSGETRWTLTFSAQFNFFLSLWCLRELPRKGNMICQQSRHFNRVIQNSSRRRIERLMAQFPSQVLFCLLQS